MTDVPNPATSSTEPEAGERPSRIYVVEPTGAFIDDPNLTDKKSAAEIQAMKDAIAGLEPIDD